MSAGRENSKERKRVGRKNYNYALRIKSRATTDDVGILTNEIIAANNRILTKRSSNCSSTNCHIDFPSSVGSSERLKKKFG